MFLVDLIKDSPHQFFDVVDVTVLTNLKTKKIENQTLAHCLCLNCDQYFLMLPNL